MTYRKNDQETITDTGVTVRLCREDKPSFRKVYQAAVNNQIKIEVEAYTPSWSGRSWSGSLEQSDGRTVWFEPTRVADKILDPVIVPLVVARCKEFFALDQQFMDSKPRRIIDESGSVWERTGESKTTWW